MVFDHFMNSIQEGTYDFLCSPESVMAFNAVDAGSVYQICLLPRLLKTDNPCTHRLYDFTCF